MRVCRQWRKLHFIMSFYLQTICKPHLLLLICLKVSNRTLMTLFSSTILLIVLNTSCFVRDWQWGGKNRLQKRNAVNLWNPTQPTILFSVRVSLGGNPKLSDEGSTKSINIYILSLRDTNRLYKPVCFLSSQTSNVSCMFGALRWFSAVTFSQINRRLLRDPHIRVNPQKVVYFHLSWKEWCYFRTCGVKHKWSSLLSQNVHFLTQFVFSVSFCFLSLGRLRTEERCVKRFTVRCHSTK